MSDHTSVITINSNVYKTLLESTLAIPWKINWATMTFDYIGPQIEELLGWSPSSWKSAEEWAARMHPDDRQHVVDYCVAQSKAGINHEADYRALKKDGGYIWIRDVVHVVRKDGEVDSLVGFMFDISERKALEQSLQDSNTELKASNEALQMALKAIKAIGGIIPICGWCGHKIKDSDNQWISVEKYMISHTEADISHGMCPDCKEDFLKTYKDKLDSQHNTNT